jgi:hypothetical protein
MNARVRKSARRVPEIGFLLAEIEVPLRAAWGDFLDQAECRVPWLDRTAEAYAARIKKALKTTAKVIANLKPS